MLRSIALDVTEHCSRGYRALLYIGTEHCSLWYRALLPMVRSVAFTEKTDGQTPKGPYTQLCSFTRAKHFEGVREVEEKKSITLLETPLFKGISRD